MIVLYILAGLFGVHLILTIASIISWRLRWAMLYPIEDMPCETLKKNHDDWWWFMAWIPRRFTAFLGGRGDPVQLIGTNPPGHAQDVPQLGKWCLSWPWHFAYLSNNWFLFAFGVRRDYWEDYWTLRLVCRRK